MRHKQTNAAICRLANERYCDAVFGSDVARLRVVMVFCQKRTAAVMLDVLVMLGCAQLVDRMVQPHWSQVGVLHVPIPSSDKWELLE